jgi:hypothetical protein
MSQAVVDAISGLTKLDRQKSEALVNIASSFLVLAGPNHASNNNVGNAGNTGNIGPGSNGRFSSSEIRNETHRVAGGNPGSRFGATRASHNAQQRAIAKGFIGRLCSSNACLGLYK